MGDSVRQVSSVAGATMVSRVLGLIRDVMLFAGLGAGPYLSAFVVAFTVPNLLRRLLGEGALTSAVVPVLAQRLERSGRAGAFDVLNRVMSRLLGLLLAVTLVGGVLLLLATQWPGMSFRWVLAGQLSALLLPYGLFVCMAAMLAAQLNTLHRFFVPALSPVWLNLVMILALGVGLFWYVDDARMRVLLLSLAVLAGGVLQAAVPAVELGREGWRPRLDARGGEALKEVWRLLLPGLAGAAILQFNLLLSRLLAFAIDDTAASILYLANRMVELPYGVFAVAVTTVAFPRMARAVARDDAASFREAYERGRSVIWLITLPAAAGLFVLAQPILVTLFEWGLFDAADVRRTVLPLQLMALALPFFSWTMLATRGLHSWKEMRLPVRFGAVNAALNLGLGLLLMGPFKEAGLAAANVVAAVALTVLMERALVRRGVASLSRGALGNLLKMAGACAAMVAALGGWHFAVDSLGLGEKLRAIALVTGGVPLGMAFYLGTCALLRVPELAELAARWGRRGAMR
jgi:putative peptidoglycan lipid II flippase